MIATDSAAQSHSFPCIKSFILSKASVSFAVVRLTATESANFDEELQKALSLLSSSAVGVSHATASASILREIILVGEAALSVEAIKEAIVQRQNVSPVPGVGENIFTKLP